MEPGAPIFLQTAAAVRRRDLLQVRSRRGGRSHVAGHLVEADLRGVHTHGVLRVEQYVQTVTVSQEQLRPFVVEIFSRCGLAAEDAATVAGHLVEADLRGVHTHGVLRVEQYVWRLRNGAMNPRPVIQIVQETLGTALIDGDGGPGQVAGVRAMSTAIEKARATGVGYVGVRASDHVGTCSYYAEMALAHDMIGFASTVGGFNLMAPWGGTSPLLGSNPFALAVPAGQQYPVVLDMACTAALTFAIARAAQAGNAIPSTWAHDRYGEPTTDASAAMEGLVQPIGGHKGSGLALVIGLLSGVLNGAAFGTEVGVYPGKNDGPRNTGSSFLAIDVSAFMAPAAFRAKVDAAIAEMRSSELARGVERIYMPGEIERLRRVDRVKSGIPIDSRVWESLSAISRELDVAMPIAHSVAGDNS